MIKTIGSFVITDAGDGCLLSKYLEHASGITFTEASKLYEKSDNTEPFSGRYKTVWIDYDHKTMDSGLTIGKLDKEEGFKLRWNNISDSNSSYEGTAFLSDGKLIGSYWLVP